MNNAAIVDYLRSLNPGREIKLVGRGWHSMVFEIDGYIYRFANHSFNDYRIEAFLCDYFRQQVTFSLPEVNLVNDTHFQYAIHKKLPGTKLELNNNVNDGVIGDCALAMARIHSCADLAYFRQVCDPVLPAVGKDCIQVVLNSLFLKEETMMLMDSYFSSINQKGSEKVLVHGDFRGDNLLVNSRGRLMGILDWCNAGMAERERDFNYLYTDLNSKSLQKLLSSYEEYSGQPVSVKRIAELALVREINMLLLFPKDSQRRNKAKARLDSIVLKQKL
ncbi:MAG: aminoglycoside phosphotransferase family protein [bacterium]|nr:aminoglycoside phosphotransferase family protein [bacterium]